MKLKYTKSLADLVARWAAELISEPTGTEFLRATKDGIFSGEYMPDKPKLDKALAVWAPGCRGKVALLRVEKTSYIIYHNHKNLVGWNLHKCGVEVVEVESFTLSKAIVLAKKKIAELKAEQKTAKLPAMLDFQINWAENCLARCEQLAKKP